ncbi:shikimate dehydrogenase [Actinophytocola oryzae]|uniref:Shikimate dehydrogenase (NADP(+)) n=1 Tax=Actinophytocola oryzae TaxID=502181 RepID=A0A4R7W1X4_9PSEU|nr:shikimate dehydrogenase [Actinophytocola oryzae]TDV56115.1 shikimate dehydrogenase [Actinophytocola oryzae]
MASARSGYLVGLVGSGIGTSLTPHLHEREADTLGIRYLYRLLDLRTLGPERVGDVVAAAQLAGYDGLNVTHPVKQLVLPHLDQLSPDAASVGAVNTVVFTDTGSVGHNTDLTGFAQALATGLPGAAIETVVLLGAGGAGAAIAHALSSLGVHTLHIADVDHDRAGRLADRIPAAKAVRLDEPGLLDDANGLVHATPTGMAGHPGLPLPATALRPDLWVADVVYRPLETELLTTARTRGCRVLDGGRMAVFQAAGTFRIITGREPDTDRMLRHFDEIAGR